jgi:putative nucleotidyltransferase with HDIG domain
MQTDDIRQRLQSIKSLQTQPAVIAKISQMLQNPATNADELGFAIRTDQVLASTVLRLVNSAFYGFPGKIASISHAIVLLGFSTVKNIVLTASVLEMFKVKGGDRFNAQNIWKHSLACGVAAQCVAQAVKYDNKEECFIAGLLHDIGKVVMFQMAQDDFMRVVDCAGKTKSLFYDTESKLLGINHQEIGGMLIEQWRLPSRILCAVSSHHAPPALDENTTLAAIVHCADIFARALGYGNGGDNKVPPVSNNAWDGLGMDNVDLGRLLDSIDKEWQKAGVYYQLV